MKIKASRVLVIAVLGALALPPGSFAWPFKMYNILGTVEFIAPGNPHGLTYSHYFLGQVGVDSLYNVEKLSIYFLGSHFSETGDFNYPASPYAIHFGSVFAVEYEGMGSSPGLPALRLWFDEPDFYYWSLGPSGYPYVLEGGDAGRVYYNQTTPEPATFCLTMGGLGLLTVGLWARTRSTRPRTKT